MRKQTEKEAKALLISYLAGNDTQPIDHHSLNQSKGFSGLLALTIGQYQIETVVEILTAHFNGQWKNGFLPHLVFDKLSPEDLKRVELWNSALSKESPADICTSGISQPPIYGMILWKLYQENQDHEIFIKFLKQLYPKIIEQHEYLYRERNPLDNGLIVIRHPWESGYDNTLAWREATAQIKLVEDQTLSMHLIDLLKSTKYDDSKIKKHFPFQIIDPLYNSVLSWSNECLLELGYALEITSNNLFEDNEQTIHSMNEFLWEEGSAMYDGYDVHNGRKIKMNTPMGMLPLIAGVPNIDQVLKMVKRMFGAEFRQLGYHSIPTRNLHTSEKDFGLPWQGPVHILINWLMIQGLMRYEMDDLAIIIIEDTLTLIENNGFYEYFDPRKSIKQKGKGHDSSALTSALYLNLLGVLE